MNKRLILALSTAAAAAIALTGCGGDTAGDKMEPTTGMTMSTEDSMMTDDTMMTDEGMMTEDSMSTEEGMMTDGSNN